MAERVCATCGANEAQDSTFHRRVPLKTLKTILGIEFLNDLYDEKTGEDRNLKVHRVSLKLAR